MASGFELQRRRMTAYNLTRMACAKCCVFLKEQFTGIDELKEDIGRLHRFRDELDSIISDIDMVSPEGDE